MGTTARSSVAASATSTAQRASAAGAAAGRPRRGAADGVTPLSLAHELVPVLGRLLRWLRGGSDGDEEGTVWDLLADWQYGDGGRLHGSAIARDQQERAVEEVAERGDDLAAAESEAERR